MSRDKLNAIIKGLPLSVQGFLNYLRTENKSQNTIISYATDLKGWIDFQFSNNNLSPKDFEELDLEDLYNYIGSVSDTKTASSIARMVSSIKSFYKYLVKFNKITYDPSVNLNRPKVEKSIPKYLTENDMLRLLDTVRNGKGRADSPERDYAMILLFLTTGIRLSELVNIEVNHINDDGNLIVKGKGNKEREIPLSKSSLMSIKNYLDVRNSNNKILFVNKQGTQFTSNGIQQLVKKYLKWIGREDLSVHKLRHSALSNMLQNGADLRTLQEIAGHSSLSTTQIYTHINNKNKKNAINNTRLASLV